MHSRGTLRTILSGLVAAGVLLAGCAQSQGNGATTNTAPSPVPSPAAKPRVLVFTKTAGFRHESIPAGITAVRQIAEQNGVDVIATEDSSNFEDATLTAVAAVVFLNTTGNVLNDSQQAALERFARRGGGFVGIHSATDTEYDWPFYAELIGARFANHPPGLHGATINVVDRSNPSTAGLPETWQRTDEWYNFASNPRARVHVLATLDESTYVGGTMGDHPIAWCHGIGKGRSWYTAGGHTSESYSERLFVEHLRGGILWAAGVENGQC